MVNGRLESFAEIDLKAWIKHIRQVGTTVRADPNDHFRDAVKLERFEIDIEMSGLRD
jgi:hypothetical protein